MKLRRWRKDRWERDPREMENDHEDTTKEESRITQQKLGRARERKTTKIEVQEKTGWLQRYTLSK